MSKCKIPTLFALKLAVPKPGVPFAVPTPPEVSALPGVPACPLD